MSRDPSLYLLDIIEAAEAIQQYTTGLNRESFGSDPKTVDATVRRFEIIGEATKRLPSVWKETEPKIAWQLIAGFRDVLAHGYFSIEEDIV